MTCVDCKDSPYPWNCGTCRPQAWTAKRGKHIHEAGCDANASVPCTCEPPFPLPKAIASTAIREDRT